MEAIFPDVGMVWPQAYSIDIDTHSVEIVKGGDNQDRQEVFLSHLPDPSNVVDKEGNIFLRKELVTNITTQNFGFGYTIAYGTSPHGVTPFSDPSLDPTTMSQLGIAQQAEEGQP